MIPFSGSTGKRDLKPPVILGLTTHMEILRRLAQVLEITTVASRTVSTFEAHVDIAELAENTLLPSVKHIVHLCNTVARNEELRCSGT
jgi:hypothetical protein